MLAWIAKHWIGIAAGGAFAYWFFTSTTPIAFAKGAFLGGNGRKLTRHYPDLSGDVAAPLADLVAEASRVVGRTVAPEAYLLASMSASEHAYSSQKEKATMQQVMLNRTREWGQSMVQAITGGKGLGRQKGRPCSTANGPWEVDLALAEANLAGDLEDYSQGALFFVHKTGFRTLTDYSALCDKWKAEHGIVPIDIGGVSSLRIFVSQEQA